MKTPYAACLSFLLVGASGCATHLVERNKEVARRAFSEVLEKGRFEVVNEVYAPDFRNGTATLEEDMAALRAWHSVLPSDATMRPDLVLGEGEYVTVLWTARATYQLFGSAGPFSSGFLDAYWVPGWLDVVVTPLTKKLPSSASSNGPPSEPAIAIPPVATSAPNATTAMAVRKLRSTLVIGELPSG